jgi:hypothetical protein
MAGQVIVILQELFESVCPNHFLHRIVLFSDRNSDRDQALLDFVKHKKAPDLLTLL